MTDIKCKQCREKINPKSHSPRPSDCSMIAQALDKARPWGLEAEVMWSAMGRYEKYHRTAPETYSVEWALECALNDWDI